MHEWLDFMWPKKGENACKWDIPMDFAATTGQKWYYFFSFKKNWGP
jgi:hypothetical protein